METTTPPPTTTPVPTRPQSMTGKVSTIIFVITILSCASRAWLFNKPILPRTDCVTIRNFVFIRSYPIIDKTIIFFKINTKLWYSFLSQGKSMILSKVQCCATKALIIYFTLLCTSLVNYLVP